MVFNFIASICVVLLCVFLSLFDPELYEFVKRLNVVSLTGDIYYASVFGIAAGMFLVYFIEGIFDFIRLFVDKYRDLGQQKPSDQNSK